MWDIEAFLATIQPWVIKVHHLTGIPSFGGLTFDSRTTKPGDLFLALEGQNTHGHAYALEAMARGAVAIMTDRDLQDELPGVQVTDVRKALTALGLEARKRFTGHIIAITGSVGKTTTTEGVRRMLSSLYGDDNVYACEQGFNNDLGVSIGLARLPQNARYGVFEIGTNHPGEIATLTEWVKPHIAMITTISESHIGNFGSLEAIVKEKACIFQFSPQVGVIWHDSPHCETLKAGSASQWVTFGEHHDATVRHDVEWVFQDIGPYWVRNILGVIAVGKALGIDPHAAAKALHDFKPLPRRGEVKIINGITFIDDTANAQYEAVCAALHRLSAYPRTSVLGRKIAVLGSMAELGSYASDLHLRWLDILKDADIDGILCCGEDTRAVYDALTPERQWGFALSTEEIIPQIRQRIRPGDILLAKGSRWKWRLWRAEEALHGHPYFPEHNIMLRTSEDTLTDLSVQSSLEFITPSYLSTVFSQVLSHLRVNLNDLDVSIYITDDAEIRELNLQYRQKDAPTNVLSFPLHDSIHDITNIDRPDPLMPVCLGDIIVSGTRVIQEAEDEGIPLVSKATHLIMHSFLHLLGYTHEADAEAEKMEAVESACMRSLGFDDPYAHPHTPSGYPT